MIEIPDAGWVFATALAMHVLAGMASVLAGSYVALLTGFYVDNGERLPVWSQLPHLACWLPSGRPTAQHGTHRSGELTPGASLLCERLATGRREVVDASAATGSVRPGTVHQTGRLKPPQRRVHGACGQVERAAAAVAQGFDHGVTVARRILKDREQQAVQMTFQRLSPHR